MLTHRQTDIPWEIGSGVVRGIYIGASLILFTYFILCTLDYIDVINISSWGHILTWTLFSAISVVLTIVHFILSYVSKERTSALSSSIVKNLCLTLLVTVALLIIYIDSDRRIDSTGMTSGMQQFFERRKQFFSLVLIVATAILFSDSVFLAIFYRK